MNWFEHQRHKWIAEMLEIYGFINRDHLKRKFKISTPQASKDLKTFAQFHPGWMHYDPSAKCYVNSKVGSEEGWGLPEEEK